MPNVISEEWSDIDGGDRLTITFDNGTSRDVDITEDDDGNEDITITDHDTDGSSESGTGVRSIFGICGYTRLDTW